MPNHEKIKVLQDLFSRLDEKQKIYKDKYDGAELCGFLAGCILAKELIIEMEDEEFEK